MVCDNILSDVAMNGVVGVIMYYGGGRSRWLEAGGGCCNLRLTIYDCRSYLMGTEWFMLNARKMVNGYQVIRKSGSRLSGYQGIR